MGKGGRKKLWLKEIASFSTKTAFTLFHAQNNNSYNMVLAEIKKILEEAKEAVTVEPTEAYYKYTYSDIPQIGIRKKVPWVDSMDTLEFLRLGPKKARYEKDIAG